MPGRMKVSELRAALSDLPPDGRLGMPADEYKRLFSSDERAERVARGQGCVLESDERERSFWFVKAVRETEPTR
jgi:hypothetical protein